MRTACTGLVTATIDILSNSTVLNINRRTTAVSCQIATTEHVTKIIGATSTVACCPVHIHCNSAINRAAGIVTTKHAVDGTASDVQRDVTGVLTGSDVRSISATIHITDTLAYTASATDGYCASITGCHVTTAINFANMHLAGTVASGLLHRYAKRSTYGSRTIRTAEHLMNGTAMNHGNSVTRHVSRSRRAVTAGKHTVDDTTVHRHVRRWYGCRITTAKDILDAASAVVDCHNRRTADCWIIVSQVTTTINPLHGKASGSIVFCICGCMRIGAVHRHCHRTLWGTFYVITAKDVSDLTILHRHCYIAIDIGRLIL